MNNNSVMTPSNLNQSALSISVNPSLPVTSVIDLLGQLNQPFPNTTNMLAILDQMDPKEIDKTSDQFESPIQLACAKKETDILIQLILRRIKLNKDDIRPIVTSINSDSDSALTLQVSRLTWTDIASCYNRNNLQKYESHLRHFSGRDTRHEIEFEGFKPEIFLPIRIQLYIKKCNELMKGEETPLGSMTVEEVIEGLLGQIAIDIETVKILKIRRLITKEYKNTPQEEKLLKHLAQSIEKDICQTEDVRVLYSGYKGHALYVRVARHVDTGSCMIFNVGGLGSTHLESTELDSRGNPLRYPYVFEFKVKPGGACVGLGRYVYGLFQSIREKISDKEPQKSIDKENVKKRIYLRNMRNIEVLDKPKLVQRGFPEACIQTAGNCVAANHDLSVQFQLGSTELLKYMKREELRIVQSHLASEPDKSFTPMPIDIQEQAYRQDIKAAQALYQKGWEIEHQEKPNWIDAFKKYQAAAAMRHIGAQARLGFFYFYGLGTKVDLNASINCLEEAAKNKNPFAQFMLAEVYSSGIGASPDQHLVESLYNKSADAGNVFARFTLVEKYHSCHRLDLAQPYLAGLEGELLLMRNDAQAFFYLSKMYDQGLGVAKDPNISQCYRDLALAMKYPPAVVSAIADAFKKRPLGAEHMIAVIVGREDDTTNYPELYKQLSEFSENGYYLALYHLALLALRACDQHKIRASRFRQFRVQNYERYAFEHLQKAAEQGYSKAWYELGLCYKYKRGLQPLKGGDPDPAFPPPSDEERAQMRIFCFQEAANRKEPDGVYELGLCYLEKLPQLDDYNKGHQYLREAIALRSTNALVYTAIIYRQGIDCIKDLVGARRLITEAALREDISAEGMYEYGWLCYQEKRFEEAFKHFQSSVANSYYDVYTNCHYNALYMVAVCYWNGEGTEKNESIAFQILQRSIESHYWAARAFADHLLLNNQMNKFYDYDQKAFMHRIALKESTELFGDEVDPLFLAGQSDRIGTKTVSAYGGEQEITAFYFNKDPVTKELTGDPILKPHHRITQRDLSQHS